MSNLKIVLSGYKELQQAIKRNPKKVSSEIKDFIQRAMAQYRSGIQNNPWRIGMSGGGSPVALGNLRDTHLVDIGNYEGLIKPKADYAEYVHKTRPWLDYVFNDKMKKIEELEKKLLDNILKDLSI